MPRRVSHSGDLRNAKTRPPASIVTGKGGVLFLAHGRDDGLKTVAHFAAALRALA